jgi:hypothetical protein
VQNDGLRLCNTHQLTIESEPGEILKLLLFLILLPLTLPTETSCLPSFFPTAPQVEGTPACVRFS